MKKRILVVEFAPYTGFGCFTGWFRNVHPKISAEFICKTEGMEIIAELLNRKKPVSLVVVSPFLFMQNNPEGLNLMEYFDGIHCSAT